MNAYASRIDAVMKQASDDLQDRMHMALLAAREIIPPEVATLCVNYPYQPYMNEPPRWDTFALVGWACPEESGEQFVQGVTVPWEREETAICDEAKKAARIWLRKFEEWKARRAGK